MVNENNQTQEVLDELQKARLNPELIQDNKLHFRVEDKIYRVRMPNQKEISEANNRKNNKYMELLQKKNVDGQPACLMEKNLIKLLKDSQNIDIDLMDLEIKNLEKKLIDKYLSLAQLKDTDINNINKLKEDINKIQDDRMKIVLDKAGYLSVSIQNQAQDEYYKFLTAMCTEIYSEVDEKGIWTNVWKNYEVYEKDDTNLPYIALGRLTELTLNV